MMLLATIWLALSVLIFEIFHRMTVWEKGYQDRDGYHPGRPPPGWHEDDFS